MDAFSFRRPTFKITGNRSVAAAALVGAAWLASSRACPTHRQIDVALSLAQTPEREHFLVQCSTSRANWQAVKERES